jgi:predicted flap endonuclease-1-like 5' DNA nuclease
MSVEIIIAFIVGLVVGLFAAWLYWRQRISEHEALAATQHRSLQERAAEVAQLQRQLVACEGSVRDLNARLDWRKLTIGQLGEVVSEREGQLEAFKSRALEIEAKSVAPAAEPPATAVEPDDLKRIEGIGPKIAGILNAQGIVTFAQLAATDVGRLEQILEEAGPRFQLASPETWPQQASLAAAGDWTALASLQDELAGGRRE